MNLLTDLSKYLHTHARVSEQLLFSLSSGAWDVRLLSTRTEFRLVFFADHGIRAILLGTFESLTHTHTDEHNYDPIDGNNLVTLCMHADGFRGLF